MEKVGKFGGTFCAKKCYSQLFDSDNKCLRSFSMRNRILRRPNLLYFEVSEEGEDVSTVFCSRPRGSSTPISFSMVPMTGPVCVVRFLAARAAATCQQEHSMTADMTNNRTCTNFAAFI